MSTAPHPLRVLGLSWRTQARPSEADVAHAGRHPACRHRPARSSTSLTLSMTQALERVVREAQFRGLFNQQAIETR